MTFKRQSINYRKFKLIVHSCILILFFLFSLYVMENDLFINVSQHPCYFLETLKLYCAGCGGTRAFISLCRYDFVDSFLSNPMVLYFAFIFIYCYVGNIRSLIQDSIKAYDRLSAIHIYAGILILLGNFIVRNILLVAAHYDYLGDLLPFYMH